MTAETAEIQAKAPEKGGNRTLLPELLRQYEVADVLGLDPRQIRNLEAKGLPTDDSAGEKLYPKRACQSWYVRFKQEEALGRAERKADATLDEIEKERGLVALERERIKLARESGEVVPNEVHTAVVAEVADRIRAFAINMQGNYSLHLERLGIDARDAQSVLEEISQDMIRALRQEADELELIEGEDG